MMNRLSFLATLAIAASFATGAQAQTAGASIGFSGYSQTSQPSSVSYTHTALGMGGPLPVMLNASALVNFTINNPAFLINPSGPTIYQDAQLTLNAVSFNQATSTAVPGVGTVSSQGGFTGTFSITAGMNVLLSGTFNQAALTQSRSGVISLSTDTVDISSSIFQPTFEEDFILGFSGGFGTLAVSNGVFQEFVANRTSGDFNSLLAIPEPATLAMAGLGVVVLPMALRVARRRRAHRAA